MVQRQFITEVHHSVSEDSPNLLPQSTLHAELDKQDKSKGLPPGRARLEEDSSPRSSFSASITLGVCGFSKILSL